MRTKFGEFFFRAVVMRYHDGPVLGDTVASIGILLEHNEYNIVDVFSSWNAQAKTYFLGKHFFMQDSYIVNGITSKYIQ